MLYDWLDEGTKLLQFPRSHQIIELQDGITGSIIIHLVKPLSHGKLFLWIFIKPNNNNQPLLSVYCVPNGALSALYGLSQIILSER